MPFTTTYANNVLDFLFGKKNLSAPTKVYIGLCSNDPEADGGTIVELSGNTYARVLISQYNETYPDVIGSASGREIKNTAQIAWTKATADWAKPAKGFFLSSSPTVGETTSILYYGKLDLTAEQEAAGGVVVQAGSIAAIDPNTLKISFPTTSAAAASVSE